MFKRLLLLGLLVSLPSKADREIRAMFFQAPEDAPEEVYLFDGEKNHALRLPRMNMSEPVFVSDKAVTLVISPTELDPEQPLPPGIPTIKLKESWSQVALLLFPDTSKKVIPAVIQAIDISPGQLRLGELYWMNLSPAQLAGKVGSESLQLAPGKRKRMTAPAASNSDYPVLIDCKPKGSELVTSLCRTTWRHSDKVKQIVLVVPQPGKEVPRIISLPIRDRPKKPRS